MKDSGIEWIGKIPADWKVERLKFHATLSPATPLSEYDDCDEVSFIPMDHLKAGYHKTVSVPYKKVKSGYVVFAEGDILMAKVTPCLENGNLAIASGLQDQVGFGSTEINVLRCKDYNPRYLFFLLQCPSLIEKAKSNMFGVAGLKRLSPDFLPNTMFPVPSNVEQAAIVDYLEKKCAEIDSLIAAKERTNALLAERRQSIIYEAVTKGLDPNVPMKDSGVEWIWSIPKNWGTIRTKFIAKITNGSDPKLDGDIPVYGSGTDSFRTCGEYKDGPAVLIGRKGATLHIPHFINGRYWNVDTAFDVKTDEAQFLLKYYYYCAICFDYNLYISATTLPSMTQTNYGNMYLPFPSIEIQDSIVKYLENTLAIVDKLLAENHKEIELLREYRQSVIFEAVTGKARLENAIY